MGVSAVRQEGVLARTHEGEPGLPRGRSGLPLTAVRGAQRERLLRSVIAAVGRNGFRNLTVADIGRGAPGWRAGVYAHSADREDCSRAATGQGGLLMADRLRSASRRLPAGASPEATLRASIAAYLGFLAEEPTFARTFFIEMPAAGPRAARQSE